MAKRRTNARPETNQNAEQEGGLSLSLDLLRSRARLLALGRGFVCALEVGAANV